jgi:hypothetical protein
MIDIKIDRRAFIAGAAAASQLLAQGASAQQLVKIRYLTPFGYLIGFAETLYADTGGFFAKQGLEVEIQGGRGSAMAVQQVIAELEAPTTSRPMRRIPRWSPSLKFSSAISSMSSAMPTIRCAIRPTSPERRSALYPTAARRRICWT